MELKWPHTKTFVFKKDFVYFVKDLEKTKYSKLLQQNVECLVDISGTLGSILINLKKGNLGIPLDLSNAVLSVAKNMIIGKFAGQEENLKPFSFEEKVNKTQVATSEVEFHKEAGWMLIQGLCSMDYVWITNNFKVLFQMWKFIFNDVSCNLEKVDLKNANEREVLLREFFINRAALKSIQRFINEAGDFAVSQSFQILIPKFLNSALNFFVAPNNKEIGKFFKKMLGDKYNEVKCCLYSCFTKLDVRLYASKTRNLLYSIIDEIIGTSTDITFEYILTEINWFDSFFCESRSALQNKREKDFYSAYLPDSFALEINDVASSCFLTSNVNAALVYFSSCLMSNIFLDNNANSKNRTEIFKHFLTYMSTIASKGKDLSYLCKALNIVFANFMLLKRSSEQSILIINEEGIFTNIKMIFDIGLSLESNLIKRICCEGHGLLIKVSSDPMGNIKFYDSVIQCKSFNDTGFDGTFANTIYLIANIIRYNTWETIKETLDNFKAVILTYFSKVSDYNNPYISQSIVIICEVLLERFFLTRWPN